MFMLDMRFVLYVVCPPLLCGIIISLLINIESKAQKQFGRICFLALETIVITTTLFVILSSDNWNRTPLLHSSSWPTGLFEVIYYLSYVLLLIFIPIFLKLNRVFGIIGLATFIIGLTFGFRPSL